MRRRDWLRVVGCGLSFSVAARGAPGIRPLSVPELLTASVGVCAGIPQLVGSRWVDVFGKRRVVTQWQVDVERVLAGNVAPQLELSTLGGAVDDVQQWVPHEAKLVAEQPHVLFVMPGALGTLWVTGMLQGAYALQAKTNDARVVLTAEQADLVRDERSACARLAGCYLTGVEHVLAAAARS